MIEILNSIYFVSFLIILFRFKASDGLVEKLFNFNEITLVEKYSINILILFLLLLFLSFFSFNKEIIIYFIFFISCASLFFGKKNKR